MRRHTRQRGTVLVVVLAVLAMLAIIGTAMVRLGAIDTAEAARFKRSAAVDMTAKGGIEWAEGLLAAYFWEGVATKNGAFDDAYSRTNMISLMTPHEQGMLYFPPPPSQTMWRRGIRKVPYDWKSGVSDADIYHNVPNYYPVPHVKTEARDIGYNFPHAWDYHTLRAPLGNRRITQGSITILDLAARFNVNFHGDADTDSEWEGQSMDDPGVFLTEVAPNYKVTAGGSQYPPLDGTDRTRWPDFVKGNLAAYGGRWNSGLQPNQGNPEPQLDDKTMNFFSPGKWSGGTWTVEDMPYGVDDLRELLIPWGTPFTSRLEAQFSASINRTGNEAAADTSIYRRWLWTTHSWVSAVSRYAPSHGGPWPKIDMNRMADADQEMIDLARTLFRSASSEISDSTIDQLIVNMIDFADRDCQPTALTRPGGSTVYGLDAMPFLNEVYLERIASEEEDDGDSERWRLYVELANPYDKDLKEGEAYTRLTYGPEGGQHDISLPSEISGRTSIADPPFVTGDVVDVEIYVAPSESIEELVEPIRLYTRADNGDQLLIDVIDTVTKEEGRSRQRPSVAGATLDAPDTLRSDYFGGWEAEEITATESCSGGFVANAYGRSRIDPPRPIESPSRTPDEHVGRMDLNELSFRRTGDFLRLLRIGHGGEKAITEALAEDDLLDCYMNVFVGTDPNTGRWTNTVDGLPYARLLGCVTVNSPYFDGIDNDGDGAIDSADTGHQENDLLGPELYQFAPINLNTAPPDVIRGLIPVSISVGNRSGFTSDPYMMAVDLAYQAQGASTSPKRFASPVEMCFYRSSGSQWTKELFIDQGRIDDDRNGIPNDFAEQSWLYGYMSNWASTRSDLFVVYGTALVSTFAGQYEGERHYMAVIDRVPATAYAPVNEDGTKNSDYLGCRTVFFSWLD